MEVLCDFHDLISGFSLFKNRLLSNVASLTGMTLITLTVCLTTPESLSFFRAIDGFIASRDFDKLLSNYDHFSI